MKPKGFKKTHIQQRAKEKVSNYFDSLGFLGSGVHGQE